MKPKLMEASKVKQLAKRSKKEERRIELTCETCSTVFQRLKSQVAEGRGSYCSRKCASIGHRKYAPDNCRYTGLCDDCGMPKDGIKTKHSRFCAECRRKRRSGEKAWNWSGGMPTARCEACGNEYQVQRGCRGVVCSGKCWGAIKAKYNKVTPTYSRGKCGKRADLGDRYFRSRWEANYARYLNWLISIGEIDRWEFEVDTFEFPVKRGNRFYTPDFKVWNKDGSFEYHEVKGWMDKDSKVKLKRMSIHYKSVKVVIIDKPQYRAIASSMARSIPGWESDKSHGIY